jgi:hypothetical protein
MLPAASAICAASAIGASTTSASRLLTLLRDGLDISIFFVAISLFIRPNTASLHF